MQRKGSTSLARALAVLARVVELGDVRADVLAREAGIPVSTVYRYLKEFRAGGFVHEDAGTYRPGDRLLRRVGTLPTPTELRRLARPTLERLAEETGETSLLEIRNGSHALCLDQVESRHTMHLAFQIGQTLPLHAGATSRVLLAYAPPDVVAEVFAHLDCYTPETPNAATLPRRLESIRRSGYATSRGEYVTGSVAIAAPVMRDNACICSISVSAPVHRGDAAWQRQAKESLASARHDLEALI